MVDIEEIRGEWLKLEGFMRIEVKCVLGKISLNMAFYDVFFLLIFGMIFDVFSLIF